MTNIQLKLMKLGTSCLFQILNTRTLPGLDMDPKNYGYFMGILIIDPNRPGPEKNRPELSGNSMVGFKNSEVEERQEP